MTQEAGIVYAVLSGVMVLELCVLMLVAGVPA